MKLSKQRVVHLFKKKPLNVLLKTTVGATTGCLMSLSSTWAITSAPLGYVDSEFTPPSNAEVEQQVGLSEDSGLIGGSGALGSNVPQSTERWIIEFSERSHQPMTQLKKWGAGKGIEVNELFQLGTGHRTGHHSYVVQTRWRSLSALAPLKLPSASLTKSFQSVLSQTFIKSITPDIKVTRHLSVNDTHFSFQWPLVDSGSGSDMETAWDIASGEGVTIAVLDTGYTWHPDLLGNLISGGYDFISDPFVGADNSGRDSDASDPGDADLLNQCGSGPQPSSWHGTHVMGLAAAEGNNQQGIIGVAHNANILPVRVLGRCGGYFSDIVDAVIWSAGGGIPGVPPNPYPAKVINLSLGGIGRCPSYMQQAIDIARELGATVVVSAGNQNRLASQATPANCDGVITVAAVTRSGERAFYSNYGAAVDIAAPGGDGRDNVYDAVLSTINAGFWFPTYSTYGFYMGTSMSAPHVSGAAALLYELNPEATPEWVEKALTEGARHMSPGCRGCGAGILDVNASLLWALEQMAEENMPEDEIPIETPMPPLQHPLR